MFVNNMNRLYRKEIKDFFSVLQTHHVTKLEKPDDSEFGMPVTLAAFVRSCNTIGSSLLTFSIYW
jgi:hypothetical protein